MSQICINYQEMTKLISSNLCFSGAEGICYLIDDKTLFKLYKGLKTKSPLYEGYQSNSISFPIDIYNYEKTGLILGYTMKYLEGRKLFAGFMPSLSLDDLISAYNGIRSEIKKFPDIYMDDMYLRNILYDYNNNKINLIDTDKWYFRENGVDLNLEQLSSEFMNALCNRTIEFNRHPLSQNVGLNELYEMYINGVSCRHLFLEFLKELKKEVLKEKETVNTIGDLLMSDSISKCSHI